MLGDDDSRSGGRNIYRPSRVRAMFASRACRSSIMIGTALSKGDSKQRLKKCMPSCSKNSYTQLNKYSTGPKYSNYLKTGLVWYSNGRFLSSCQMIRYSNDGLKTRLKKTLFSLLWVPSL